MHHLLSLLSQIVFWGLIKVFLQCFSLFSLRLLSMSGNDSPKTTFYTGNRSILRELQKVFREYHYQNRTHSRRSFRDVRKSYRMIRKNASFHLLTMASHQKNNIGPWLVLLTVLQHDCIPQEIVCLLCKVISFSRALLVTYSIVDQFFPSEDNDD